MSAQDVIKKSFLDSYQLNQSLHMDTAVTIVINMMIAVLAGICIYVVYRKFYNGVIYSRTYALTLIGMTILTCMVTLAISTNVIISLGMVGALSIVRYRTAIKEPLDLLYMFWAITSGITVGAGMYILVIVGYIVMTLFIFITFGKKFGNDTYLVMVQYEGNETADEIIRELPEGKYKLKSKIYRDNISEMTIQLQCKENKLVMLERVQKLEHVKSLSLVKYDGEYHS